MSILKSEDRAKWTNAFIAFIGVLAAYLCIRFLGQLGEWFDLEAKISNFVMATQAFGAVLGIGVFIAVFKNKNAVKYLSEVYGELVKVIWPDKDAVLKATIGIVIGVAIASGILVLVDFIFRKILSFIY